MHAYFDHAATSPMPAPVLEAYAQALAVVGNPASTHRHGQHASQLLESARERIAGHFNTAPALVTLTGSGTESINLALKGMYWAAVQADPRRNVLLIAEGEHHATLEAAEWLRDSQGAEVHWLPIDEHGVLQPDTLSRALHQVGTERVALVSFLWANNEVGSVLPVDQLTAIARSAGVQTHVDAVAALGGVLIDFSASGATAVSLSAHKIGGPIGVGALLLARDANIEHLLHGGNQQRARSGTQNVAGAIAFAAALDQVYSAGFAERTTQIASRRDRLVAGVLASVPDATVRGSTHRLPGNAHFTFSGCQGDSLVFLLDAQGFSASMGSACQAGVAEVSHVLLAMGLPEHEAIGSLRFTLSAYTTEAEIDAVLAVLPSVVENARHAGIA